MESIPLQQPQDEDIFFDVPLAALLARCAAMAHRFWRQQGRFEPYEEYLSAGNAAIAECLARYNPAIAPPGGFKSYCIFRMDMGMRNVRLAAAGPYNMKKSVRGRRRDPKYVVQGMDHAQLYSLRPARARQELACYLGEVVRYLADKGKPAQMLHAQLVGASEQEIAEHWACSVANVRRHMMHLRHRLRIWAAA
jgi:hypothetical protein